MFTVAATQTYGIFFAPTFSISASSASRSTLPLNGLLVGRVVRLGDDHVDKRAAGQFLVQPRGGEIHVAGHEVARLDQDPREDVLGAAALVGRHDVAVAVVLLDRRFEVVEVAAAGVGLVAQHHARPLPVAHRAGAAVGQQVDVDVLGAQQEGVVAGLGDGPRALGASRHLERFDDLDLPRFGPGAGARGGGDGFRASGHGAHRTPLDHGTHGRPHRFRYGRGFPGTLREEAVRVRILGSVHASGRMRTNPIFHRKRIGYFRAVSRMRTYDGRFAASAR